MNVMFPPAPYQLVPGTLSILERRNCELHEDIHYISYCNIAAVSHMESGSNPCPILPPVHNQSIVVTTKCLFTACTVTISDLKVTGKKRLKSPGT
jgi:hypothetical protein